MGSISGKLLVLLISVFSAVRLANAFVQLIQDPEEIRSMTWAEIEEVFKRGTIDEGIPEGYGYGLAVVKNQGIMVQAGTDLMWHGKHVQVVSGTNCPGRDCGAKGAIFNYLGAGPVYWQEMPGICYIGYFHDIKPQLKALELDDKPSVIVDYLNGGGDEIRLVNSEKRIYLGRGGDWTQEAAIFAYFVLEFRDEPKHTELSWVTAQHHEARDSMYRAAGGDGDPNQSFIQARPSRLSLRDREP